MNLNNYIVPNGLGYPLRRNCITPRESFIPQLGISNPTPGNTYNYTNEQEDYDRDRKLERFIYKKLKKPLLLPVGGKNGLIFVEVD